MAGWLGLMQILVFTLGRQCNRRRQAGAATEEEEIPQDAVEVQVGKRKMGKIKRAAVTRLDFTDVEVVGLEKMRKNNLVVSRRRQRERIERQQKRCKMYY
jgi:hypothetical protein